MNEKAIVGLVLGIGAITGLVIYVSKHAQADEELETYECAFCEERFSGPDAIMDVTQHMENHIQSKWGLSGAAGWIPEDVSKDGVINVLDMIMIGQQKWSLVTIDDRVYKIVF